LAGDVEINSLLRLDQAMIANMSIVVDAAAVGNLANGTYFDKQLSFTVQLLNSDLVIETNRPFIIDIVACKQF
jgi:hypothetical protein